MTNIPDATAEAFVKAWNEPDSQERRSLLHTAWAEDATFSDAAGTFTGREALNTHMGQVLEATPNRMLEHRGWIEGVGGRTGFRWRLRSSDGTGTVVTGHASAQVTPDGRFARVDSSVDSDQSPKEPSSLSKLRSWTLGNPLSVATLFVLALYLALRIQAQRFYRTFGVTPEDAGFGPVDLVVRQATHVLLDFARIGLIWSVAYLVGMVPWLLLAHVRRQQRKRGVPWELGVVLLLSFIAAALVEFGVLLGDWLLGGAGLVLLALLLQVPRWRYPAATAARANARRMLARWAVGVALFGSLAFGTWTFVADGLLQADSDAALVHEGGSVTGTSFPWRARPVTAHWKTKRGPYALPGCKRTVYLGEANGRVVLYDRQKDRTLRVSAGEVHLTFPSPDRCNTR